MTVLLAEAPMLHNPAVGRITSGYSLTRVHPVTKIKMPHLGTDVANTIGTPIRAAAGGKVRGVATGHVRGDGSPNGVLGGRTGNAVLISHDGWATYYGHLARVDVTPGQTVTPGQVIGLMGDTGVVTGPHLHYEVHPTGTTATTDPVPYMQARGITLGTDTEEDDMYSDADRAQARDLLAKVNDLVASKDRVVQPALARIDIRTAKLLADGLPVDKIVAGVLAGIPQGGGTVDAGAIADAVRAELAQALVS